MPNVPEKTRGNHIRSCDFCRARKSRCDGQKPSCRTCIDHQQPCSYQPPLPKPRPTKAVIDALRAENRRLLTELQQLKAGYSTTSGSLPTNSEGIERVEGGGQIAAPTPSLSPNMPLSNVERGHDGAVAVEFVQVVPDRQNFDTLSYLSVDDAGNFNIFGPSSAWQTASEIPKAEHMTATENVKNTLIANAALMRQEEHRLAKFGDLDGVPIDLATHLLDLHWNRQHHSFLLTYRPVIIKSILEGNGFGSKFLLNCIFACASKFSIRPEARKEAGGSRCAGFRFFQRCDELMNRENLLLRPNLPTIVGLLLLGSTYVSNGATTKGWLLTGYALRMVYDLGLHIDRRAPGEDAIEGELRKRIFWGAFICDKLQSLYLGRPFAIKLRDAHVSLELNDTLEENEIWTPYVDPTISATSGNSWRPQFSAYSVSCFQRLCLLAKIMTRIIDEFYVVGATALGAQSSLRNIDDLLCQWERNLPDGLQMIPVNGTAPSASHPPNVLCLHAIYNALIILLHRPLVADGHLRSTSPPAASWKRCSEAAERITHIVASYRHSYSLRGAPYLISYGLYVACTIHVRNIGVNSNDIANDSRSLLECSVFWLSELAVPNPAVETTVSIIQKLITSRGLQLSPKSELVTLSSQEQPAGSVDLIEGERNTNIHCTTGTIMTSWEDPDFYVNEWDESFSHDLLYGFLDQQFSFIGSQDA